MSLDLTPYEALLAAVEAAGSQTAFASICRVSQAAVWKWIQSSKRLPEQHVLAVEAATKIPRHLLRPDIYPADLGPGPRWCDPRWYGVDMSSGPDTVVVSAVRRERNGNRINVLDVKEQRRRA